MEKLGGLVGLMFFAIIPGFIVAAFAYGGKNLALLVASFVIVIAFLASRKAWTLNESFPWWLALLNAVKWIIFMVIAMMAHELGGAPLVITVAITTGFLLYHFSAVMGIETTKIELEVLKELRSRLEILEQAAQQNAHDK